MNLKVEDFAPLAPLVKAYELQPGKHYILVVDGRHFNYELANALLQRFHEEHPEIAAVVVATMEPKVVQVLETTLADALVAAQREWLDEQPPTAAGTQNFITAILPLLNRAVNALRGQNGSATSV